MVLFRQAFQLQPFPVRLPRVQAVHQRSDHRLHRLPGYWIRSFRSSAHVRVPYPVLHFLQTVHLYSDSVPLHTTHTLLSLPVPFLSLYSDRYRSLLLLLRPVLPQKYGYHASLFQDLFLPVRITYGILRSHYPAFLSIRSRLALPSVLHPRSMGNTL